jgi:YD repeat-containing protein
VLDPEGRNTVNTYDKRRRLETVTNHAQETTRYAYDLSGNRTQVTRPKGNGQSFEYDAASRLTRVSNSLEPGKFSELAYDLHGNLASRKDALGHVTGYQYDSRHRRWKTTFADTTSETLTHDGVGNVKTLTDANGVVTTYTFDERSRERLKAYSASADGLVSIGTGYDGNGNVIETQETYASGTRTHIRRPDAFNRLEQETDPWGDTITHTYDAQGNRKSTTAQGSTTRYDYDVLNRRKAVTAAGGTIETVYDRTHLPVEVRYPTRW